MIEHSPTPWVYHRKTRHITVDGDERMVADIINVFWGEDQTHANAEFIIKACNAFDDLMEALLLFLWEKASIRTLRILFMVPFQISSGLSSIGSTEITG